MKVGRYPQAIGTTQQISFRGLLRSEATDLPESHLPQMCFQVFGIEETQPRFPGIGEQRNSYGRISITVLIAARTLWKLIAREAARIDVLSLSHFS